MKKNFIIIGLGRFGVKLLKELMTLKCDVLAVDKDEDSIKQISSFVTNCIVADCTKIDALKELGIRKTDHVIITFGNNLQDAILTILALKEIGIKDITVRVDSDEFVEVIKKVGANNVIIPNEESAKALAHQIVSDNILDYYQINDDIILVKLSVGPNFDKKTLLELNFRKKYSTNVICITRNNKTFLPLPGEFICPFDILTVVGEDKMITKLETFLNK